MIYLGLDKPLVSKVDVFYFFKANTVFKDFLKIYGMGEKLQELNLKLIPFLS